MDTTEKREAIENILDNAQSRRQFAKRMVVGGLSAYGVVALGNTANLMAQQITDVDILNFALQLEYLEAEFYTVATTGKRIQEMGVAVTGRDRAGDTAGGRKVALDARTMVVAEQIAVDERAHVNFLRAALRSSAVAKPAINLDALNLGFNSQAEFLTVAAIFEDVGVSAYRGAAPLIDNSEILSAAAGIALTEAQHAGLLRFLTFDANLAVPNVDAVAVPTLRSVNGVRSGRLFFVDGNALSPARTTSEVLRIVYGGGRNEGGFFPNGLNGVIEKA